jgi:hypothetical protein
VDEDARKQIFEEGRVVGFAEGREIGQREGLPFVGVNPLPPHHRGAKFEFARSWVDSFVSYERDLTECLRSVQRRRFLGKDQLRREEEFTLSAAQKEIEVELDAARRAVDVEVERGLGRPRITDALRGPPRRPRGVREYPTIEAFVAEDRRRALFDWPDRRDAGGSDWGTGWGLERPIRRWETTRWRVSWLGNDDPTNEVYAVEFVPLPNPGPGTRRVWMMGTLANWKEVEAAISPLYSVRHERNSLVAVANAVAAASSPQPPHEEDF